MIRLEKGTLLLSAIIAVFRWGQGGQEGGGQSNYRNYNKHADVVHRRTEGKENGAEHKRHEDRNRKRRTWFRDVHFGSILITHFLRVDRRQKIITKYKDKQMNGEMKK